MPETAGRMLLPALSLLLAACWVGGGVTADATSIDEWLQLLALPVMLLAAMAMAGERMPRPLRWGAGLCVLVALVPALQLLPLPAQTWGMPAARHALGTDLAQAGVTIAPHWSLAPSATEQALWSLLPALAAFLSSAALPQQQRRRLLQVVVLLVGCNLLFAFFQAGLPPDSQLRLYSEFNGGFGGLFANTNHQATACIIGMTVAVGLASDARLRARRGEVHPHRPWWYLGLAGVFLLMVPLSTSRAGMAIALPVLALALVLTGVLRLRRIGRSKRATATALVLALVAVVGVRAAMGWMEVDQAEELRHAMASVAVSAGTTEAPLGAGVGSFVPVFAQAAPASLRMASYVNHAHNEYAQWWLEAGWLGMAVLALVLVLLAVVAWRIVHSEGRNAALAGASLVAICAVLAHSWADYPLRTTTLMATAAALAGVMLASLADARERKPRHHRH